MKILLAISPSHSPYWTGINGFPEPRIESAAIMEHKTLWALAIMLALVVPSHEDRDKVTCEYFDRLFL